MLFTFPSRYWCAIGLLGVFSLAGWSRRVRTGFLVPRPTQACRRGRAPLRLWASHPLRGGVPAAPARGPYRSRGSLQPRAGRDPRGLGCSPFARRYSGNRVCFLFPRLLRCFSSPRSPALSGVPGRRPGGLPHSDTPGSKAVCASPGLFAACRVLHRLQEPGHPPCALPRFPRARAAARPRAPPPRAALSLLSSLPPRRPPLGGRAGAPSSAVKDLINTRGECRIRTDGPRLAKPVLYR